MFTATDYIFCIAILAFFSIYLILKNVHKGITLKVAEAENEVQQRLQSMLRDEVRDIMNIILYLSFAFLILFAAYRYTLFTGLGAHVHEWLNLLVRWAHILFGIAWIGASFYFIFLENRKL